MTEASETLMFFNFGFNSMKSNLLLSFTFQSPSKCDKNVIYKCQLSSIFFLSEPFTHGLASTSFFIFPSFFLSSLFFSSFLPFSFLRTHKISGTVSAMICTLYFAPLPRAPNSKQSHNKKKENKCINHRQLVDALVQS